MIYINLLPWRESRSQRLKKKLVAQSILALILPGIMAAAIWLNYWHKIQQITEQKDQYFQLYQPDLSGMNEYDQNLQRQEKLARWQDKVNRLVSQRQKIPDTLAVLTLNRLLQPIEYLAVDHQKLVIRGLDWSTGDAMSLFQHLQKDPGFCQVALMPASRRAKTGMGLEFELQAQLCDVGAGS